MLFTEFSMKNGLCILLICVLAESATPFVLDCSSSNICVPGLKTFLHDLNSQCPFLSSISPIQVDGESFEKAMSSSQKNEYTAVLFYASWCPFSNILKSKFSSLSSIYPQIKHMMVEKSSAMPSIFSRYGIHSVPSLLIVNQTTQMRYLGGKDRFSLILFYKETTGLYPVMDMVEETLSLENGQELQFSDGTSVKEIFTREPYLVLSAVFVLLRGFLYFFPVIASRLLALCVAYIPHLNLEFFGESRYLLGYVLHLIDIKRIWSKLKICKARNFLKGARNARVWASSLASVSLGKASSSRVFPSRGIS